MTVIEIRGRRIGPGHPPLVIAEIGINHEGSLDKAVAMVDAASAVGCECVKIQSHVLADEMVANNVVPGNADESIWAIVERCQLSADDERRLKGYIEDKGLMFLATPFSRAAARRLGALGVEWFKIGSGECNNYPLVDHIARYGKPVILSTGMNDIASVARSAHLLRRHGVPFALMQCTSIYPTPWDKVRLGAMLELGKSFPDAVTGLSDHSLGNYACFAAVALGASIVEKHFTCDKTWPGPDVPLSLDPAGLEDLVVGVRAVAAALGGGKAVLDDEQPTIDFAYACVVATAAIGAGELLNPDNIWVKRPGTGEILARHYDDLLGRRAARAIAADKQIEWADLA